MKNARGKQKASSVGTKGVPYKVTLLKSPKGKGSSANSIPISNAAEIEDIFTALYWTGVETQEDRIVLKPPYDLAHLRDLGEVNNTLEPCVSAYEINIDGTGAVLEVGGDVVKEEDAKGKALEFYDFFAEIAPRKSLLTLRKALRRDLEYTGNAYMEVVRNFAKEIICINLIPSLTMRLCRLGEAVSMKQTLRRGGVEKDYFFQMRPRAYAQVVGARLVYFKDFGVDTDIHKATGKWQKEQLPFLERGNEIVHFTVHKASNSPYGIPRWIAQTPSVIGSRQAEELNLGYFDSGGLPPILIFLSGGYLGQETRKQLDTMFNAKAKEKIRGAVIEVSPSGGSIDKEGSSNISIERFGSETTQDSLFEKYDDKCERKVRRAFRLPPLFFGASEDHTLATATVAYVIAEAQVFAPERLEFDDSFNTTIMAAMDPTRMYKLRSNPVTVKYAESQLKGLMLAKGVPGVETESFVDNLNKISGTALKYDPSLEPEIGEVGANDTPNGVKTPKTTQLPIDEAKAGSAGGSETLKKSTVITADVIELADTFLAATGILSTGVDFSEEKVLAIFKRIDSLNKADKDLFTVLVSARVNPAEVMDLEGVRELCSCAVSDLIKGDVKNDD